MYRAKEFVCQEIDQKSPLRAPRMNVGIPRVIGIAVAGRLTGLFHPKIGRGDMVYGPMASLLEQSAHHSNQARPVPPGGFLIPPCVEDAGGIIILREYGTRAGTTPPVALAAYAGAGIAKSEC